MNVEVLREYCLSKKGTSESFPFDGETLVFKVLDKMFALIPLEKEVPSVNLKADPDYSLELREKYPQIYGGFHMNKKHWNTVEIENGLDDKLIMSLVDHSYEMVVSKFTKKNKAILDNL